MSRRISPDSSTGQLPYCRPRPRGIGRVVCKLPACQPGNARPRRRSLCHCRRCYQRSSSRPPRACERTPPSSRCRSCTGSRRRTTPDTPRVPRRSGSSPGNRCRYRRRARHTHPPWPCGVPSGASRWEPASPREWSSHCRTPQPWACLWASRCHRCGPKPRSAGRPRSGSRRWPPRSKPGREHQTAPPPAAAPAPALRSSLRCRVALRPGDIRLRAIAVCRDSPRSRRHSCLEKRQLWRMRRPSVALCPARPALSAARQAWMTEMGTGANRSRTDW